MRRSFRPKSCELELWVLPGVGGKHETEVRHLHTTRSLNSRPRVIKKKKELHVLKPAGPSGAGGPRACARGPPAKTRS